MYPNSHEVDLIFARTEKSEEILRSLYELFRSHNRKFSFRYLCHRLGSNSKGHLSYMMEGKRRIPQKYWIPFFQIFKLSDEQAQRWQTILEAEAVKPKPKTTRREAPVRAINLEEPAISLEAEAPTIIQSCAGYITWF